MSWLGSRKDPALRRSGILTVLDVGSSKVCCVMAKLKPVEGNRLLKGRTHHVQVIGIGHQKSQGVKSGVVVDLDRAEHAIRLAVDAAERMARLTADSLIVNLSAGRIKSELFTVTINLGGHEVDEAYVKRLLSVGAKQTLRAEREVIHSLPIAFSLDAERGVRDPRGMVGEILGVDTHVLTGDSAPLRNLELCINRSHLSVEQIVATPYASGLAALVDDELEMGAACIDMGGGTTTLSIFSDGQFVHAEAVPVGGNNVTVDLAKGLSTRLEDAEQLKMIHGSVLPSNADDRDLINIQPISVDEIEVPLQIPRFVITRIIRARIDETFELLRDRLNKSGYGNAVGKRVVLTGGASQLIGLPEAAKCILGRNVRIGRPLGVAGLPETAKGPAFATAVGLLIYPQMVGVESQSAKGISGYMATETGGRLYRMSQWLRDSF